jgi:hypothetical protein
VSRSREAAFGVLKNFITQLSRRKLPREIPASYPLRLDCQDCPSRHCSSRRGNRHRLLAGGVIFHIAIGVYLAIELLSLQVDIFNLNMAKSENSIGIAQGPIAPLLNWVYMVINLSSSLALPAL